MSANALSGAKCAALRALPVVIGLCVFTLLTINVSAQDGTGEEAVLDEVFQNESVTVPETPAVDHITAAERALVLRDNGGGAVQAAPASSAFGIFRVILTLALSAAAIYGLVFFIKRIGRGKRQGDPFLKVLASTPLGTNRSAHIVAAGSKAWLVGTAENGVNLISEIEDQDLLNAMFLEDSRKNAAPGDGGSGEGGRTRRLPDFRALLRRLGVPIEAGTSGPESIRRRREKLREL